MTEAEITTRLNELSVELQPLLDEQSRLQRDLRILRSPFKIGDLVEWSSGGWDRPRKVRAKITAIGAARWGAVRIRRDGSEGSRCIVWGFNKPKLCTDQKTSN